jgi:hypothetical protein
MNLARATIDALRKTNRGNEQWYAL